MASVCIPARTSSGVPGSRADTWGVCVHLPLRGMSVQPCDMLGSTTLLNGLYSSAPRLASASTVQAAECVNWLQPPHPGRSPHNQRRSVLGGTSSQGRQHVLPHGMPHSTSPSSEPAGLACALHNTREGAVGAAHAKHEHGIVKNG